MSIFTIYKPYDILSFMNDFNSVVLLGCKHCGKSTHGKALASFLKTDFFDTDSVLEQIVGTTFQNYYRQAGVAKFMQAEEQACQKIVSENSGKQIVVATGGGICDNPPALNQLRPLGKFIFLELDLQFSVERILSKIHWDATLQTWANAPAYIQQAKPATLAQIKNILMEKYTQRFELYRKIADVTVPLKNQSAEENFKLILQAIGM